MRNTWNIRTLNSADGAYSSISRKGAFEEASDGSPNLELTTERGLSLSAGTVTRGTELSCNWALIDILLELQAGSSGNLAILEDLKSDCRIHPLGE